MMMEKAGLDEYLNFYLSNQDVNKGKPDPEMYSKAIEKFQLQPDECLILEDNENGIKAALASGAHLLKVETVLDVNYFNIVQRIKEIEEDA
jgi:HAD superfamily hydrolase (TIGR01509 family)